MPPAVEQVVSEPPRVVGLSPPFAPSPSTRRSRRSWISGRGGTPQSLIRRSVVGAPQLAICSQASRGPTDACESLREPRALAIPLRTLLLVTRLVRRCGGQFLIKSPKVCPRVRMSFRPPWSMPSARGTGTSGGTSMSSAHVQAVALVANAIGRPHRTLGLPDGQGPGGQVAPSRGSSRHDPSSKAPKTTSTRHELSTNRERGCAGFPPHFGRDR